MRVSAEGVVLGICVAGLLGPVISVVIRQVTGPVLRPFVVDGLSVQCLGDLRGIRVVCDDQVVFAVKGALLKWTRSVVSGRAVAVRYWGGFPRLAIFVDGKKVTSWPFTRAEWWGRFFAVGWPVLCIVAAVAVILSGGFQSGR